MSLLYCIFSNDDPDFVLQNENTVDTETIKTDEWKVHSLYEFQYFNCLGCSYKSKTKQEFVDHLYENHPEAILTLGNIKDDSLSDVTNPWIVSSSTKTGPKLVPFMKASPKTQKNRLAAAYKLTKDTAWRENVPFNIVLGKFGSRYYHKIDPSLKALFDW